ncbi:MAG: hypothetical protein AMXMBFR44_0920 [Candidatus Campbellbacteria bacterium]
MRNSFVVAALLLGALFDTSSPLLGHTEEERRTDLVQELSAFFEKDWVLDIFNHQDLCAGREIPIERLRGGWPELERQVLHEDSVARGVAFFEEHYFTLTGTSYAHRDKTNTLPFVTVAILRIESDLGENRTGTPVIRTLFNKYHRATDGPGGNARRRYILEREIVPFMRMAAQSDWDVCGILGTRAAAFGYPHFIPESLRLSADGDGDGTIDLMWSVADAVASIGNYLEKTGWHRSPKQSVFRYNPDWRYVHIVLSYAKALERAVKE